MGLLSANRLIRLVANGSTTLAIGLAVGCVAESGPPAPTGGESIGVQLRREEPQLREDVFRDLLDFESGSDSIFVKTNAPAAIDALHAHTGRSSLLISGGATSANVKLASLLSGQKFPGPWTLVGGYFYCTEPGQITISLSSDSVAKPPRRTVALIPGRWTPVLLDIARQPDQVVDSQFSGDLEFTIDNPRRGPIWIDDLMVVDNTRVWYESSATSADTRSDWTIRQRGFRTEVNSPGKFNLYLSMPETAESGWRTDEANAIRARFSSTGKQKLMTVYADGRQYLDGKLKILTEGQPADGLQSQHAKPGTIDIPEAMGSIKRDTVGDENNDAYNETRGAYQITATGPRLDLKISPASSKLISPVLEIEGLPKGTILVTMEGRLVSGVVRTKDDHVVIQLPGEIERETAVNITIR